jgi:hypothetical protein
MEYSASDQPTEESIKTWTASGVVSNTYAIFHDKRGNLLDDGRQVFEYDALNRLTGVWQSMGGGQTGSTYSYGTKGHPIAAFTYDGYAPGWNLYQYVNGMPWNAVDPMGLDRWSWYDGWGDTFKYLFGFGTNAENSAVRDAYEEGLEDGKIMTADTVTFGLTDAHSEAERIYQEGDWTYGASRFFAITGRMAGTMVVLAPAFGLVSGIPVAGEYAAAGALTYFTIQSGRQFVHGVGRVASGDREGWWDIYEGGVGVVASTYGLSTRSRGPGTTTDCGRNGARSASQSSDFAQSASDPTRLGRSGKQARLRELEGDPNVSSSDRGWIRQELNSISRGQRKTVRVPPGKNLAHRRGFEAKKGYGYDYSDLQDIDLHKLQHKHEGY